MDGLIGIAGVAGLLLVGGGAIGLLRRAQFSPTWLVVAVVLVVANDAMLTRAYGAIPRLLPSADWNWQGKATALVATLIIAALPAFGWRRSGLTLVQAAASLPRVLPAALAYCSLFLMLAWLFPGDRASPETVAFQLTMPGLEEEPFYRGILLLALDRAFAGRIRLFGVDWGWGAILSCTLFGLAHGFGYAHGAFAFDPLTFTLTALPSFVAVWIRLRTGSLLLPVLLHNFGNAISLLV